MHRRALLASVPAAALAGCLDGSVLGPADPADDTESADPGSAADPSGTPAETTVDVTFHTAIRYYHSDDSVGVDAPERDQFAFVSPPPTDDAPPPEAFALELGDETFEPRSSAPGFSLATPEIGELYASDHRSGHLAFDVPTVDVDEGALMLDGRRHPVAADTVPAFATAPDLVVRSVDAPESTTADGTFEVRATVANEGDARGTFLGGIYGGGLLETVTASVASGATETVRATREVTADAGGAELAWFAHAGETRKIKVPVETVTETEAGAPGTETSAPGTETSSQGTESASSGARTASDD